ncbi:MAG TPA: type II secretion system protein, partial [Oceanipulchritudo sp.]|nr:type II secretion system protein [Oceanipulchritudo sp.]
MRAAAQHSPPNTAGFTLVEVIISMTLMAIVFTAAFGSYFLGMRIIEDAREEVRASQIIQSELERLRTKNW